MVSEEKVPTDRQLYYGYVDGSQLTWMDVCWSSLGSLTKFVEGRRGKHVPEALRDVSLTNREIAEAIRRHAWRRGVPKEPSELSTDERLLAGIFRAQERLFEQQEEQTHYLRSINHAATLWFVLTVLGILAVACYWLLGGGF